MNIKANLPESFFQEEEKALLVSVETKKLWAVLLDLLIEFDRVCRKHKLRYSLGFGTLLGAKRHGGFIPWDDDVDVMMLRDDYEQLLGLAKDEFRHPYFLQTRDEDPEYARCFARLRNSSTTCVQKIEMFNGKPCFRYNQGVFIDIFVCDAIPDDEGERKAFYASCAAERDAMWNARKRRIEPRPKGIFRSILSILRQRRTFFQEKVLRSDLVKIHGDRFERSLQKYRSLRTTYVSWVALCPQWGYRLCLAMPRKHLEELSEIVFEGHSFLATKYVDEYLTLLYKDWHRHVIGVNGHGVLLVDVEKSYIDYIREVGQWRQ